MDVPLQELTPCKLVTTRGQAAQHKNWLDDNNLMLNNLIIKNWQVNHELSFTSDHFPITWLIDQDQQPMNAPSNNPRFNLKETKVTQWTEAFSDAIDKHQNTVMFHIWLTLETMFTC
jgi:hypothetical protein